MQRSRTNLLSLWRMSRKKDGHCKQQKRVRGGEGRGGEGREGKGRRGEGREGRGGEGMRMKMSRLEVKTCQHYITIPLSLFSLNCSSLPLPSPSLALTRRG